MIQYKTKLNIVDNSGVKEVQCIGLYKKQKNARIGDKILVVIKKLNKSKKKEKSIKKLEIGFIRKAIIVRTKIYFKRKNNFLIKFFSNDCIFINKKEIPIYNRIKGPILFELAKKNI